MVKSCAAHPSRRFPLVRAEKCSPFTLFTRRHHRRNALRAAGGPAALSFVWLLRCARWRSVDSTCAKSRGDLRSHHACSHVVTPPPVAHRDTAEGNRSRLSEESGKRREKRARLTLDETIWFVLQEQSLALKRSSSFTKSVPDSQRVGIYRFVCSILLILSLCSVD